MRARLFALSAAGCIVAFGATGAAADMLRANYSISLIGLTIGAADVAVAFEGAHYSLEAHARVTGLASLVVSTRGASTGAGEIEGGHVSPRTFAVTAANSYATRTVRMALASNTVAGVDISPPYDPKPDLVPVTARDQQGVVDPVGAAMVTVAAGVSPTSAAACDRTVAVFDGATRFDIALAYVGERKVKTKGYAGPVAICTARYSPVAGYRRDRPLTKFWQDNRDIEVWLAPVQGKNLLMPYRLALRTPVGMAVVEATEFRVEGK